MCSKTKSGLQSRAFLKLLFMECIMCKKCETVAASVCGENKNLVFVSRCLLFVPHDKWFLFKCLMVEILTWSDVEKCV